MGLEEKPLPLTTCPRCGAIVVNIKGSRLAVCRVCGQKMIAVSMMGVEKGRELDCEQPLSSASLASTVFWLIHSTTVPEGCHG